MDKKEQLQKRMSEIEEKFRDVHNVHVYEDPEFKEYKLLRAKLQEINDAEKTQRFEDSLGK